MLPDGFHWNEDHSRLRLRSHTLIVIDPAQQPVTLLNIMRSCLPRRLFFLSHDIAIRYAETWANKWEPDIRLHVGNRESAAELESRTHRELVIPTPTWTSTDETRRRRGGNRNWPLKKAQAPPGTTRQTVE